MSMMMTRRTGAALAVLAALTVAALVLSAQSDARNVYACVKGNGTVRVYTKKPKCKGGESRVTWASPGPRGGEGLPGAQGLLGPTGVAGATGAEGKKGATGAEGKKGATGAEISPGAPVVGNEPTAVTGETAGEVTGESSAECPSGEKLVGGGALPVANGNGGAAPVPAIEESYPASATKWVAKAAVLKIGAAGSTLSVKAYALCVK
jgi:Collagen triple helix repeat (20 copies)